MNDYEQRKQDRIDRYLEKAGKARAESSALSQQAHTMLSAIPPGQPMLPDHYSYIGIRTNISARTAFTPL